MGQNRFSRKNSRFHVLRLLPCYWLLCPEHYDYPEEVSEAFRDELVLRRRLAAPMQRVFFGGILTFLTQICILFGTHCLSVFLPMDAVASFLRVWVLVFGIGFIGCIMIFNVVCIACTTYFPDFDLFRFSIRKNRQVMS